MLVSHLSLPMEQMNRDEGFLRGMLQWVNITGYIRSGGFPSVTDLNARACSKY